MRRLLLVVLVWMATAGVCWGQVFVPIQSLSVADTGACTLNTSVNTGDIVFMSLLWETSTAATSISDSLGISFTQLEFDTSNTVRSTVYGGVAGSSGAETITITETGAVRPSGTCFVFPAGSTSLTVDGTPVAFQGSSASTITHAITTTYNGELILSFTKYGGNGVNVSTTDKFLGYKSTYGHGASWKYSGTNGSYTSTYSYNGANHSGALVIVALQPPATTPVIVSPATLPSAVAGEAYSYTMQAVGGVGAYTWSLPGAALPPGLTINSSTGEISGTPTNSAAGASSIQVSDGTNSYSTNFTLPVGTAYATITHVKDSSGGVFTGNVTSGNMIKVPVEFYVTGTIGIPHCTDSLGTVFKLSMVVTSSSGVNSIASLTGVAPSTGSDTVTCDSGTIQKASEFSNVQNFPDNTLYTVAAGSPYSTGTITTLATNSLLYSVATSTATTTGAVVPSAPCNSIFSGTGTGGCYLITTTIGGYSVTYTDTNSPSISYPLVKGFRPSTTGTAPVLPSGYPVIY